MSTGIFLQTVKILWD